MAMARSVHVFQTLILLATSLAMANQREFDYFVFSLEWPATICQATRYCCSSNGCCRSDPLPQFTIRTSIECVNSDYNANGLWPDFNYGSWPACCSHKRFDVKKISSLLPALEKYWPSLYCSSPSLCFGGKGLFWAHEWEKHGTCSYPVIKDEYSYFSTVLDLYAKYNMSEVLKNAGFIATNGERYLVGDVVAAIRDAFGASPLLVCKHGSLEELRLCFYKDFQARDCLIGSDIVNDYSNSRSSCPSYIRLPTYEPLGVGDVSSATSLLAGDDTY